VKFLLGNNNDEAHGGHIVEQLASGAWLEITGEASGPVDSYPPTAVDASGNSQVWYCPTPSGYPFPCSRFEGCSSGLRLTLIRR
jgi:hypothetical protein